MTNVYYVSNNVAVQVCSYWPAQRVWNMAWKDIAPYSAECYEGGRLGMLQNMGKSSSVCKGEWRRKGILEENTSFESCSYKEELIRCWGWSWGWWELGGKKGREQSMRFRERTQVALTEGIWQG